MVVGRPHTRRLTDVADPVFSDGAVLTSDSTLRFRGRGYRGVATASGYVISDVRDAPDRPGREVVLVARAR